MYIPIEELTKIQGDYEWYKEYGDGYRIVYFYDDYYTVGEYCKTIEGFMIGFAECDPIVDEDDIPDFVSIDDLLDRCLLDVQDASAVAIYKTDGTCIGKKYRCNLR